jgi:hypothetical protein
VAGRRGAGRAWLAGLGLGLALWGCGELEPAEPTLQTALGVRVWFYADPYPAEAIDAAFTATWEELGPRWSTPSARRAAARAQVSFLDAEHYELAGRRVAGNVSVDGGWIYVAARGRALWQTALVHELVHYFDIQVLGGTDEAHLGWGDEVDPAISRINARLADPLR